MNFIPLRRKEDRRLMLLEVSYTALGAMDAREMDKTRLN